MDGFTATMIAEGQYDLAGYSDDNPPDQETVIDAWQYLIDTGIVWQLQGYFGHIATQLIEQDYCHR